MRRKVMSILLCFMMIMSVLGAMVQYVRQPDSNKRIDKDIITSNGEDGYEFANEDSKLKVYFDESSMGDGVKVSVGDQWVVWKWKEMSYLSDNDGIEIISTVSGVEGTIEENMVTYDGTYPFSEEIFTVSNNRLKHDIILSQLPYLHTSLDNVDYLSYIGIIEFPSELSMYVDGIEQEGDFITSSNIMFVDENGIELFYMPAPYAYEKNNEQKRIDCQYEVKHANGEILFIISTPFNWLSDPARNFPVVIDPTIVSGYLYSDTIWTVANSPYIVTDDITVVPGVTLTIEPGVVVKFDGPYELVVDGYLNAQGTDINNIVFTSNSATPSVGDWLGIKFRDTSPDHGSILDWVTIMYSDKGIVFEHSSQNMAHMNIAKNNYGVYISTKGITFTMDNSSISESTYYGIHAGPYYINMYISDSEFFNNDGAIYRGPHGVGSIYRTKFYDNYYGLYIYGGRLSVYDCEFYNNTYGVYRAMEGDISMYDCKVYNNIYGIYAKGYSSSVSIYDSDIFDNSYGIYGVNDKGRLTISGSNIHNNLYLGITSPGPLTITDSSITNNGGNGIEICRVSTIHYSDIYGNLPYDVKVISDFYFIVNASDNWWGTTNNTLIDQKIYDYYDDYNLTIVFYGPKSLVPWASNNPPVANIAGPYIGEENSPITFDASGSHDPDGDILQYRWDLNNNGVWDTSWSSSPYTDYTWGDDYSGIVIVEVYDGEFTDTATSNVTIFNVPPMVVAGSNQTVDEGDIVSYNGSFTDPGWLDSHIATIDWGDGTIENGGVTESGGNGVITGTHVYGDNGEFIVTITVIDDEGLTGSDSLTITVHNVVPSINIAGPNIIDENSPLNLEGHGTDPGSDDLTFTWEFEFGPTITNIYYNNGMGPDSYPNPEINPMDILESVSHIYGDKGVFAVTLTVEDDDGGIAITTFNVTVNNVLPVVDPGGPYTIDENLPIILTVITYDTGSDDLTITWDWGDGFSGTITTTYYNDDSKPDLFPSPDINPISITESQTHTYGDNGVFNVTLTVEDDDGGTTIETVEVIVNNIAPTILNIEAHMHVNFSLRVAGEKWHSVNLTLFEDDIEIWNAQVTREPGSPDEQAATLSGYDINFGSTYSTIMDYIPNDPRINGNVWGGNPVWIDLEFQDGTNERLHHTFNVRRSDWDSDHWNHIDPWEVDLTGVIYRHNITFEAIASDPGSDDLTLFWDFGDGGNTSANIYFNNEISPDPYPSPEINPINVSDTVMHAYVSSGVCMITLTVMDDDGGFATTTIIIIIPG